ncbi:hypothetical protein [Aeromicrobium sp. Leaf350]|uniref:hypothetical protein n=1 Tax=Aeromicrobium sp. Leaf350 TaxID=2876565 RepID=UPI001E2CFC5A|nr:hypothetical protein [Aeromicrobium sp. Leaf350]
MTWDAYHRRKSIVADVLAIADADATATIESALASVPGADEVYPDHHLLLLDVQLRWSSALSTRLDLLVGDGADTPEIGVINAWIDTAAALPGARRLLDQHRESDTLARAVEKENEFLARAAGVPAMSPGLAGRGREIVDAARDQSVLPEIVPLPVAPPSLLERLRNALAA